MKFALIILTVLVFEACNQSGGDAEQMQNKIDSLQKELANTYRPGFGEFMAGIQLHHAKLWFAGMNQNWPLADFEVHEIQEAIEDIQKYCSDRAESKPITMINLPMDSVINAIQQKNEQLFKVSFVLLTNTCNSCHNATDHAFNVVTIPTSLPVTNQEFKPQPK